MKNPLFSSNSARLLSWLWLVIVLSCTGVLLYQGLLQKKPLIETNILALLPENRQNPVAQAAFDKVTDSVSNKVIFVLSGTDRDTLHASADWFAAQLSELAVFKDITARLSAESQQQGSQFYFQHRFQFLSPEQQQRISRAPEEQTQYVIQSVYNPFSGVTGAELGNDPFLLFRDYASYLSKLSGKFKLDDGYLTQTVDGKEYVLVVGELGLSPYSLGVQQQVPAINQLEASVREQYATDVMHTGVLFYAAFGTQSAKSEISTIGLGSLLGVLLLFLVIYRSTLPLMMALLSIFCGFVVALAGSLLLFEKIHLFSLVFGSSLIGVSIDYSFHYLTERLAEGKAWNAGKALRQIFGAITLGLITSLIGYMGLLIAPFPGLQQLSVFSVIGLVASYITVVCWYPKLASTPSKPRVLPGHVLWKRWLNLWRIPRYRWGLPLVTIAVSCLFIGNVTYNDDIHQLQAMPKTLKQQEDAIQTLSGVSGSQQMLLVAADSEQALLSRLGVLSDGLNRLIQDSDLQGYQSIHQYLPGVEEQQANYLRIQTLYQKQALALESALGISVDADMLTPFTPVSVADFLASPVARAIGFLWLGQMNEGYYSVVMLNGVTDIAAIKAWAHTQNGVFYLNKADEISRLFGEYRGNVTLLLAVAIVAIWLLLSWRYSLVQGAKMVLPPIIAGFSAIAVTGVTGQPVNLFNLLALILILGIGIDYTLFFTEQKQSKTTLLAITLSALTTILSFGLLALSNTNAIHSFGITILTGIFVSWLLSPLALNTCQQKEAE